MTEEYSIRSIVFLEDASDFPVADSWVRQHGEDPLFISLSPSASHYLSTNHILHRNLQYYSEGTDFYRIGLDNYGRLENVFRELDPELKDLHGIPTLDPARYTIHHLKILFDVLFTSIAVTRQILDRERPDAVRIPKRGDADGNTPRYSFGKESAFATVLSLEGWKVPVRFLEREPASGLTSPAKTGHPLLAMGRGYIASYAPLMNAGLVLSRRGILPASRAFLRGLMKRSAAGPVLIYGSGYNWDDALVELYRNGWGPVHRIPEDLAGAPPLPPHATETIRDVLDGSTQLLELGQFLSIDTGPYLKDRISSILADSIAASTESYRRTTKIIEGRGIRALLISTLAGPAGNAAVQAARDAGIPVVSWQHGGSGYTFHPFMPYVECFNADLHLVFGSPVAEKYREAMDWLGWRDRPSIMAVGSSSLDRMRTRFLRHGNRREERLVLYVTTLYLENAFYISQPRQIIGWDEHLWEVQKKVIDLAGRFPEWKFMIKLHPAQRSGEPLRSYIRDARISNIRCITTESSLEDLIPKSSLMLFDLVSTGILQAMLTDIPIFLYPNLSPVGETVLELLGKRAAVFTDPDRFVGGVADYLGGGSGIRYSSFTESSDFIRAYGIHEDDGKSGERAVSLLERMVKGIPDPKLR